MRSVVIAALSSAAYANDLARRDAASDFNAAADELISSYIPPDKWTVLTSSVGAAASKASVTGDVSSVIFSALKATDPPQWFEDAIPAEFKQEIGALESAIDDLRPITTVVQVTTTDADGKTITTEVSTTVAAPRTETSVVTTETTDANGNKITTSFTTTSTTTPTSSGAGEGGKETSSGTSSGLACMPTAVVHAVAGVAAVVGVAMAM